MSADTIFQVSLDEKLRIEQYFEKSNEEIDSIVKNIQEWLRTQPHIPHVEDEELLKSMLKLNKFNIDKTKKKIDMYYSIKHVIPEFFENRSPLTDELKHLMDTFMFLPLPQLTNDLYRVYIVQYINNDPSKYDLIANAKYLFDIFDIRLYHDPAPGEIYIYDLAGFQIGHMLKMNPMTVKKIYAVMEKAYSDRIKGIHFLNMNMVGQALVSLIKMVVSEKIAKRVFIHKDVDSLMKVIPSNILPVDYNGSQRPLDELYGNYRKFVVSQVSWLIEQGQKKSNEDLRPNKEVTSKTFSNMFGFLRRK